MSSKSYTRNTQGIYSDDFDGESVVVNLNLGNYYSLRGIANQIWHALSQNVCIDNLTNEIATHYAIAESTVKADIKSYINRLEEEALIIEVSNIDVCKALLQNFPAEYETPALEVFNDLQDLFLLDPVHAVDDKMGWPVKPQQ